MSHPGDFHVPNSILKCLLFAHSLHSNDFSLTLLWMQLMTLPSQAKSPTICIIHSISFNQRRQLQDYFQHHRVEFEFVYLSLTIK